ncbi:cell wall protein DAN4-like [Mizuhopecten yessoensis]|uniref:cell wall protein DAN4-like n=1 Tax=Mizuhopecten yessoensis TaxID=6573 RepID=UPI000B45E97B|nr:cell wall protein DAN4-like [Mizuhopecten yessoensis]
MLQTAIIATFVFIQISLTCAVITSDPECGKTKGCYPSICPVGGCQEFHLSWEDAGEYLRFKMIVEVPADEVVWAAIGFSKDNRMRDTSVVMCKSDTMTAEIGHNDPSRFFYAPLRTVSSLQDVSVSRTVMYMTCMFSRIKIPREFPAHIFALNRPDLYLLNARGPIAKGGMPNPHTSRQASASPVSFMIIGQEDTTTTTTTRSRSTTNTTTTTTTTRSRTTTATTIIASPTTKDSTITTSSASPTTKLPPSTSIDTPANTPTSTSISTRRISPTAEPVSTAMPIINTVSSMMLTCLSVVVVLILMT